MNRRFLVGVVIFACFFIVIKVSYACIPIEVYIWDYYKYVPVGGDTVEVTADVESGGPAHYWDWDYPGGLNCSGYSEDDYESTATFSGDTAGTYTVYAEAENYYGSYDYDWAYVKVVEVTQVIGSKYVLAVGEEWTYAALTNPQNSHPYVDFTWDTDGGDYSLSSGTSLCTVSWDTPGTKRLTAYCGSSSAYVDITVYVKVDKIVEEGTTDEGPLYVVCITDTVDLEAKPYPEEASFPDGEPHWLYVSGPAGAYPLMNPTYGSSTTTVSGFLHPGTYQFRAKCGDSDVGDTISVITPPTTGYWEEFNPDFGCPPAWWETPFNVKGDDCSNMIDITCPDGDFIWKYNGTEVGHCVWTFGRNNFQYKVCLAEIYGKERFLETKHVTQNDAEGVDAQGEGCDGFWCWRVQRYDCVKEEPVVHPLPLGSSPWWRKDEGSSGTNEHDGVPCLGQDGIHNNYPD